APPGFWPFKALIERMPVPVEITPTASASARLDSRRPAKGRHARARNHPAQRKGTVDKTHAASSTSRFSVEYARSVEPSRNRIPPIVLVVQSRRGSSKIALKVRQENSSINAWYKDSLGGASARSTTLATIDG